MQIIEIENKINKREISEIILEALPEWFGIPEATKMYINESCNQPFLAAMEEDEPVGFISMKVNNQYTVEIFVMGILPEYHKRGIGRTLFDKVYSWAKDRGYEYLQVKTLDESHPDVHYAGTRNYYLSMGFRPLECLPELWGKENPCLIMVQYIK